MNSLRNIALTAPYMHDGRFSSLEQVMDHYSTGVRAHPNLSPQLHDQPPGEPIVARQLNLTFEARSAIIAFLQTLTDEEFLADPKFSDPF